jgi:alkylation response protein AidB-like acyl-CoA dehydrogenase
MSSASDTTAAVTLPLVRSDEERLMRETVASICSGYGPAYSRGKHAEGLPPTELWDDLAGKGYLGVNIPEEWGGGGLGMAGLAAVGEEIAAAGSSLLLIVVSPAIVGSILARHGTPDQNDRWLRGIAAGTTKVAFAITEPDAGTNSHNLATSLERRADRFVLRGQKTYISGVEHADAVLVVARSRLPDGNLGLPSLCLVDVDAPGFTREPIPMPYVGPDQQWTLFFDDVELDEDRLVGGEGGGLGPVFDGLNPERIMGATIACGAGRRALAKASAYANERVVWRAPIGTHQGVSHPLAEAKIELELARLMTQKAAALCDARAPGAGEASNMAKFAAAEAAIKCVDRSIQAHGGNGFALEYELTDMWWGVRLTRTAPVSREMILNYVAEHSLGLPKSY